MAIKVIFLEEFGKAFVPKKLIPYLRQYLLKAGFDEVPYKAFGLLFYVSAIITGAIYFFFIYPYVRGYSSILLYAISFGAWFVTQMSLAVLFILLVYFYLDLRIFYYTRSVEEQLPDYLQLVSANLKGGMTFERALWSAIKPRFDVLGPEMARASKKVTTGYEISKALTEVAEKYDSLMLRRTVDLMISELDSGGNVAQLIDRIVDNLREVKSLKDEMSASAIAYVIFISMIVIFISPLLFALSYHLLLIILSFVNKIAAATSTVPNLLFQPSKVGINPKDFQIFSLMAISVISFFSSLIVSLVEKGNIKGGIKYIPIYMGGSLGMYLLFMKVLGTFFVQFALKI